MCGRNYSWSSDQGIHRWKAGIAGEDSMGHTETEGERRATYIPWVGLPEWCSDPEERYCTEEVAEELDCRGLLVLRLQRIHR